MPRSICGAYRLTGHPAPRFGAALIGMMMALIVSPAEAQQQRSCKFLCAPKFKVEPTITITNLGGRPRILDLEEGTLSRAEREAEFEVIFSLDIPTTVPRLAFTFEAIWTPATGGSSNPFTGATATELGVREIRDNPVELEFETNLILITAEPTGGWLGSHFDIVDKLSPAERPRDTSAYTHKLNLELDTAVAIFNWLPKDNWLRNIELEGSLDYVATGLPRAGDEIPRGKERFLDDASRWSFSIVFVIPVAPF